MHGITSQVLTKGLAWLLSPFAIFFSSNRLNLIYLGVSIAIGYLALVWQNKRWLGPGDFLQACLPKEIYEHPSAKLDYWFLYTLGLLKLPMLLLGALVMVENMTPAISGKVQTLFALAGMAPIYTPNPLVAIIICTVAAGVAADFGLYFAHYLMHKVPMLWEFHKVHHAAEVLTPFTVARQHVLDDFLAIGFSQLFAALMLGLIQSMCAGPMDQWMPFGVNALFVLFYLFAYHLRHSHVWLDYGPVVDRVFVSPAQHQIHHSRAEKHWDKNFGFIFAFWDQIFGTLYVPREKEEIEFGIAGPDRKHFDKLWKLYFLPFVNIWRQFKLAPAVVLKQSALVAVIVLSIVLPAMASFDNSSGPIFMADLTSPEVKDLIAKGYTTVLVPTGGVEQGGPHVILGKHNYVVTKACQQIAQRLGKTLVAPTLPFSYAGNISPPTAHMTFAGTISLSPATFERVLEDEARSLKQHGFKLICLIADHGDAVPTQDALAARLSNEWKDEHVKVLDVSDYYQRNGQTLSCVLTGMTPADVGAHCGVKDTSELLAVHASGVREDKKGNYRLLQGAGADGDSTKANAAIGEKMLELKVRAALQQILKARQQA